MTDTRILNEGQSKKTVRCPSCSAETYAVYHNCWNCLNPVHGKAITPAVMYRYGKSDYTRREIKYLDDNRSDFLQPYTYDKLEKKMVKNKEFVDKWGDPEQKVETGAAVHKAVKAGAIELKEE